MQIQIVNKNIDVSPAIKERITDRLDDMMDKYIHREGDAHVVISKEGSGFRVVCDVNLPSGVSMQGSSDAATAYAAADDALDHTEKRLRRYSRRLKSHQAQGQGEAMAMFILENPVRGDDDEHDKAPPAEPMVIAESSATINTMTVAMAALKLGLSDTGAVVFRNAAHGEVNVVFKRSDGNVGWIDPNRGH
ncbi:MAG: ribosome-associated translation inhibitor RaiA [Robiginitomaculum sp.]